MWLVLFRIFAFALLSHAGYVYTPFPGRPMAGLVLGAVAALGLITLESKLRSVPGHHMVGALVGGVTGLFGPGRLSRSPHRPTWSDTDG